MGVGEKEAKKYYCTSFRVEVNLVDNFKGWYIEYTNEIQGYSTETDMYSRRQVWDTEEEAINSIAELRRGVKYKKVGY